MTWPVAGFSTGISSRAAWPLVLTAGVSVLAMGSPLLRAAPQANDFLRDDLELSAHERVDPAEVGVAPHRKVLRRARDRVGRAAVDRVVAERAGVPDAVGPRVVADVGAVAGQVAGRDRVADLRRLVHVDEGQRLALLDGGRVAGVAAEAQVARRVD